MRLVADSAERHRGQIVELLDQIRAMPEDRAVVSDASAAAARGLARTQVAMAQPHDCGSAIVSRRMVEAACNLKLPMLRSEMNNYVRRFTSLLRQALSLDYSANRPWAAR